VRSRDLIRLLDKPERRVPYLLKVAFQRCGLKNGRMALLGRRWRNMGVAVGMDSLAKAVFCHSCRICSRCWVECRRFAPLALGPAETDLAVVAVEDVALAEHTAVEVAAEG